MHLSKYAIALYGLLHVMIQLQKALKVSLFLIAGILETADCIFGFLMSNYVDKLKCIYCKGSNTESAGLCYRPMFKWDNIAWCMYQQLWCTSSSGCASNQGK
jgi:hypothetical protein